MKLSASQLAKRAEKAQGHKSNWDAMLSDAYEFALPMRNTYNSQAPGQQKMDRVFDSTAINSVQNFASILQQGVTPPFQEFLDFLPGVDIPEQNQEEARKQLKEKQKQFFEIVHASNFDLAIAEFNTDLAVGTASMLVMEGTDDKPLNHIAVPNSQISIDEGAFGSVDGVFRRHNKPLRVLEIEWPDMKEGIKAELRAEEKDNPGATANLVEGTYYDNEADNYVYQVLLTGTGSDESTVTGGKQGSASDARIIVERTMDVHPWIITRWIKVAGEVYGRGPLLFSLPDIKTLNKAKEFILQRASFDVAGMWEAVDDGVMNPDLIEITPGAVISVAASGNLRGLAPASNMDVSQLVVQDLQMSIKESLLDESLPSEAGPVRSPTEIIERVKRLQQKTGTPLARYMSEFLEPWANRCLSILHNKGIMENRLKVDGKIIKIKPTSPLAQQQNLQELQDVLQYIQIAQGLGPEVFALGVKVEEVPEWLGKKLAIDPKLMRNAAERKQAQELAGQAMAQQQAAQAPAPSAGEPVQEPVSL